MTIAALLYTGLLLATLTGPAAARPIHAALKPVHVALKPAAAVLANADGFFTLGAVADVTGGGAAQRMRLAAIVIGRAPLSGESRHVTRGDLALKLRQAGCDPDKAAVLEGADAAEVTTADAVPVGAPLAAPSVFPVSSVPVQDGTGGKKGVARQEGAASGAPTKTPLQNQVPVIHRGDPLTIVIQTGPLTITAPGVARESGGVGQTIRVHREGVMTDLSVQVLDAQTGHLEI